MREHVLVLPLGEGPTLPLLAAGAAGHATAAIWPGIGASARSIVGFRLDPGSSTLEFRHPGEAVYFVRAGSGEVIGTSADDPTDAPARTVELSAGAVVHVAAGTPYRFRAAPAAPAFDVIGGPCPPDPAWFSGVVATAERAAAYRATAADPAPATSGVGQGGGVRVLSIDEPALMLPIISSDARMIAWPGNGAWDATMNYVRMEPGEENTEHAHAHSEDTIVILEGRGSVDDLSAGRTLEFKAGDVIHVPARVRHAVRANRGSPVVSAGGPCPADLVFLRRCGAEIPDRRPATETSPATPATRGRLR